MLLLNFFLKESKKSKNKKPPPILLSSLPVNTMLVPIPEGFCVVAAPTVSKKNLPKSIQFNALCINIYTLSMFLFIFFYRLIQ